MRKATANLYACLPAPAPKLELAAPANIGLGQSFPVTVRFPAGEPFRRVLVAQLKRPDGRSLPVDQRVWETRTTAITGSLATAINDPAGEWTLVVSDVASGVRSEVPLRVVNPASGN